MQVLTNLLGNAIKFTPTGHVALSVSLAEETTPQCALLRFIVQDTGIGISKNRHQQIFEPFTQVGTSAHVKYGGTGLGLSICKNLVELMGGTIRVESEEGHGSTFSFTASFEIVREKAMLSPPPFVSRTDHQAKPLNILLVEDNIVNRTLAVKLLSDRGNTVMTAEDGKEGLEKLKAANFDLVLMDVRMPVMDGVEATQRIRQGEAGDPKIPIVALTAYAQTGDREKLLNAGMDDYLAKPLNFEELDLVLARVMRKKETI
jgi:CheY-like chemotaxis protein